MRTIIVSNSDQLGRNIYFLRRSRRISMDAFCRMYDIPKDMLLDLELGNSREIYLDSLSAISKDWEIDINDLVQKRYELTLL